MATPTARAAAAALAGLLAVGCASATTDSESARTADDVGNPYNDQRLAQVRPVLDRWAQALRDGNEDVLRALTDSAAAPDFLDRQLLVADGVRDLDFTQWSFTIGDDPEVFVTQDIADRVDALDVWAPPVYLTSQLAGVDEEPVQTPVGVILARRGDTWTLVSDNETADSTHPTWPAGSWVFGPTQSQRVPMGDGVGASLVLFHPEAREQAGIVADMLPAAVDAVADFWGADWDRSVVVEIASTDAEFSALTGNEMGRTDVAAASISLRKEGQQDGHGQRIVFSPSAFNRLDEVQRGIVLRHELSHLAVRRDTGRGVPEWLAEGVPDYVAYRGLDLPLGDAVPQIAAMVSANGPPDSLPVDADFAGPLADLAYQLGRTVSEFVVEAMGEDELRELYRALAGGGLVDGPLDAAVREVTGMNMNQFTSAWSRWLGAQFGS